MSSVKKSELTADVVFVQDAIRDGRCRLEKIGIKNLGKPDRRFQARVEHLNESHLALLKLILDQGGDLFPIVVFRAYSGSRPIFRIPDGHHRHAIYSRCHREDIPANVFDVELKNLDREAMRFAAMSNQTTMLARTREDIQKALGMVFEDPECWTWSESRIGRHCGTSPGVVARAKAIFGAQREKSMPTETFGEDGRRQRPRNPNHVGMYVEIRTVKSAGNPDKGPCIGEPSYPLHSLGDLIVYLATQGLFFRNYDEDRPRLPDVRGILGHNAIVTNTRFEKGETIPWSVGCLQMLRSYTGELSARMICLCNPEWCHAQSIAEGRKNGVEFMDAVDLVKSLRPPEPVS